MDIPDPHVCRNCGAELDDFTDVCMCVFERSPPRSSRGGLGGMNDKRKFSGEGMRAMVARKLEKKRSKQ